MLKHDNHFVVNDKNSFKLNNRLLQELKSTYDLTPRPITIDNDIEYYEEEKDSPFVLKQQNKFEEETKHEQEQETKKDQETDDNTLNNISETDRENQTAYYDDTELKEMFEDDLENYTSDDFIIDLVLSLQFDLTQVRTRSPKLFRHMFFTYDDSLERYVHLYEHIVLLAHGF